MEEEKQVLALGDDLGSFDGRFRDEQSFMLPHDVEVMDGVQKFVPSKVSLRLFDRGSVSGFDPLFVFQHLNGSQKLGGVLADREVGLAVRFSAVCRQQGGHEDIEGRPGRIDDGTDVTDDQGIEGCSQSPFE